MTNDNQPGPPEWMGGAMEFASTMVAKLLAEADPETCGRAEMQVIAVLKDYPDEVHYAVLAMMLARCGHSAAQAATARNAPMHERLALYNSGTMAVTHQLGALTQLLGNPIVPREAGQPRPGTH